MQQSILIAYAHLSALVISAVESKVAIVLDSFSHKCLVLQILASQGIAVFLRQHFLCDDW